MGLSFTRIVLASVVLVWIAQVVSYAQTIQGQIIDFEENKPVGDVAISNIHASRIILSDKEGKFLIEAIAGELVEFKKEGYKVIRVRLPQGKLAPFFKVVMQKYNPAIPQFENMASPDYKTDSLKYALLYKKELEFPQMSAVEAMQHPFSAMSKKNRQVWAFQREYAWYQEQKYIDYTFNDNIITSMTGLSGDSLRAYKQLFRPTYTQLRSMGEYTFLNYIKRTVTAYRKRGIRARTSPIRSSH